MHGTSAKSRDSVFSMVKKPLLIVRTLIANTLPRDGSGVEYRRRATKIYEIQYPEDDYVPSSKFMEKLRA